MIEVKEYEDATGRSPFSQWFSGLNAPAANKVMTAIERMGAGNFSNVKGVGGGVLEYRIDFGPGYRVYLGRDGDALVILVGGSTKKRQSQAIEAARGHWRDYKQRKRKGEL